MLKFKYVSVLNYVKILLKITLPFTKTAKMEFKIRKNIYII